MENEGLLADSFHQRLHVQLATECDSAATVDLLRQLAQPTRGGRQRSRNWLVIAGVLLLALLADYLLTSR